MSEKKPKGGARENAGREKRGTAPKQIRWTPELIAGLASEVQRRRAEVDRYNECCPVRERVPVPTESSVSEEILRKALKLPKIATRGK